MSDIIRLLPDSVANQIAAGEVIQRPASVIKELVENSIDAGASLVQIRVVEAGKSSIQVIDNGKGMSGTDARMAFERHATSKIREATDLFALNTMGFRGEALASIVAVAQVELRTRREGDELGTSLVIEGSKVKSQDPVACPVGANFLVNNLFFNIPARRKFLKSNQTELSNILAEYERVALANPQVAFTLHSGDNLLSNLPISNFKQRILNIFGKKLDAQLISIKVDTSLVKLHGYIGSPKSARKKGAHQFFFVNGRFMRHPYFNKAIQSAYERLIPEGEQVSYFISFEVEPTQIDVNIHPSKTEIKFQDEKAIWPILLAAVRESLGKFNAIPTIDFDTANRPDIPTFYEEEGNVPPPQVYVNSDFNPFDRPADPPKFNLDFSTGYSNRKKPKVSDWQPAYQTALDLGEVQAESESMPETEALPSLDGEEIPMLYDQLPAEEQKSWEQDYTALIQYRGRYILASGPAGLLLIDQHRAHFRILYDRYKRQLENRCGISQGLLFPQLLQLSPSHSAAFECLSEELKAVGYDLSPLGGGSYSILGIPSGTEGLDPVQLLQSMADDALSGEVEVKEQLDHFIALSLSRKAALPVGQMLDNQEMTELMNKLFASSNPNLTPDGTTILVLLDQAKLDGFFG